MEQVAETLAFSFRLRWIFPFSPSEFVMDFARVLLGSPKAKLYARVVMAPRHVRLLLKALEENIKKYEEKFGEIKVFEMDKKEIGLDVPSTG